MMTHTSIKLDTPCEFINITPLNPLISKCQIKVCYVGEQPNRNHSIITKETAVQLANSLPGSPIVGFFNEAKGDFEEHNRTIDISNGEFRVKDTTVPYGFVDLGAKVWFQKFLDDGMNEHEYLMTEGYLWTGQYPECKRVIEKGNNQSMELDNNLIDAHWTKDDNGKPQFFIINEAIISKLCILGEGNEPCFEGSNITKVQFSFEDGFKQQLFSMMNELKELLNKGGTQVFTTYAVQVGDSLWNALYSYADKNGYGIEAVLSDDANNQKFAVLKNAENVYSRLDFSILDDGTYSLAENVAEMKDYTPAEEPQFATADVEAYKLGGSSSSSDDDEKKKKEEDKEDKSDASNSDNKSEGKKSDDGKSEDGASEDSSADEDEKEPKKKKYALEEIPEYVDLQSKYSELESKYNALTQAQENLNSEVTALREFKLATERVQKENMIKNTFYMLNDEDKKDVIDNIDTYSLDEIEAKLSVICVRNRVSFAADDEGGNEGPITYNLGSNFSHEGSTPAWVKAVLDTAKTLN